MKILLTLLCLVLGSAAYAEDASSPKKSEPQAAQAAPAAKSESDLVTLTKDNTLVLNDAFYGETVSAIEKQAKELDARIPSGDPLYLVLNTPGGYIDDGLEMIQTLSNLKRPVHTITLFAASMGFQTVQGLGDRLVMKNGTLMSHKARGGFSGEFPGQLDSRYSYYLKRVIRMDEQAVKRTNGKHTLKSYHDLVENEYWCDGQDCIDQGFADRVANAQCDKSLEGTKNVVIEQFVWRGHTIEIMAEYDNCPLNTNALKYIILIDGEPLFKGDISKKEVAKAAMPDMNSWYTSYYGGSSTKSATTGLSAEDLAEIKERTDKVIQKHQNREVVKGY